MSSESAEYYVSGDEECFIDQPCASYDEAFKVGREKFPDGFFIGKKGESTAKIIKDCDFADRILEECEDAIFAVVATDDPDVSLSSQDCAKLNDLVYNFLLEKGAVGDHFTVTDVKWVHPIESRVSDE